MPTARPPLDAQTVKLQRTADQVRTEILEAVDAGCAFTYEEATYRSSGFHTFEDGEVVDRPMGQVTTAVIERDADGRIGVIRQSSRSGLGGASPMGGSFSRDLDFASWTGDQLDGLTDMLTRGDQRQLVLPVATTIFAGDKS